MRVEFLGTAGYHPSETRHTSGVLLPDATPDDAFLLDAGSGTFRLANHHLPERLHIFLSHAHLDHVMGLTFLYGICYNKTVEVKIYGEAKALDASRDLLFQSPLFPLEWSYEAVPVVPGAPFFVSGVKVSTFTLNHPGGSLGYRFDWAAKSLAYVTDTAGDGGYHDAIKGVDLLIHERNFADRLGKIAEASGHCTSESLIAAARESGAKQVIATHFNPLTPGDPLEEDDVYSQIPGVISARDELSIEF